VLSYGGGASSIKTGAYTGQAVMTGYLQLKVRPADILNQCSRARCLVI
jgi:hypothetical protein